MHLDACNCSNKTRILNDNIEVVSIKCGFDTSRLLKNIMTKYISVYLYKYLVKGAVILRIGFSSFDKVSQ